MLECASRQCGANLSERVFESNSRIASLGFEDNDRNAWRSRRRESA